MIVTFSVPFVRGQGRPRFGRMRAYKPAADRDAERAIRDAYKGASIRQHGHVVMAPDGVPVSVAVVTARRLPKSFPKRVMREHDTHKPDASNVLKLVEDALNGVAYADDAQITETHTVKRDRIRDWCDRTYVTVYWEGNEEWNTRI
jgi:Holliday junction resolvase RusA-like endonuclease